MKLSVTNPNPVPARAQLTVETYLAWASIKQGRLQGVGNNGLGGTLDTLHEFKANETRAVKIELVSNDRGDESVVNPALKTLQFSQAAEEVRAWSSYLSICR